MFTFKTIDFQGRAVSFQGGYRLQKVLGFGFVHRSLPMKKKICKFYLVGRNIQRYRWYSLAMMSQCFIHVINPLPSWPGKKTHFAATYTPPTKLLRMFLEEMCTRARLLQTIIHTIALHCWSSHYVYSRCLASRSFFGGGGGMSKFETSWNRWTCSAFK